MHFAAQCLVQSDKLDAHGMAGAARAASVIWHDSAGSTICACHYCRKQTMPTLANTATASAPKRAARATPKKPAGKPFKLQPRDADLAEYKVSTQKLLVAMRNLYRD